MDKVYRLYTADQISPEGFGRQYGPLEERAKAIEEELPRLQGEVDFLKIQLLSKDEILAEARDLYERWPSLSEENRRQIIEAVLQSITVGKEEIEIDLAYFPSPPEIVVPASVTHSVEEPIVRQRINAPAATGGTRAGSAGARRMRRGATGRKSLGRSWTGST
jgi:hypothetical protein